MRSYRALYLLAQQLASKGFETLRFDYSGTGDSADPAEGVTLERWIEDIRCAARELKELSGADRICLLGLRLGALLATRAIEEGLRADAIALWDVPDSGLHWIAELQQLDRQHYEKKNRYLPARLQLQALPGELLGCPWPDVLDWQVAGLMPSAPASVSTVLQLRSQDAARSELPGEEIHLPDEAHWKDVHWLTRPWIPTGTQRAISKVLGERLQ